MEALKKYNPIFSCHNDLIAFAVHLSFLQHCRLVGLSQDQYLEDIGSVPQGWNRSSELYTFRYVEKNAGLTENKPKESSSNEEKKQEKEQTVPTILVKIIQLEENSLIISAVRDGSENVITLDLNVSDHVNLDQKITPENTKFDTMYKDFGALKLLIEERITNKVIPSQNEKKSKDKDDKDDKDKVKDKDKDTTRDDLERYPNYYESNQNRPSPYGDFDNDLNPIPNGGIGGIGGVGIGGGGLMGPRHPRFGNNSNRGGLFGTDNPRPGVPDGARFDPFGPGSLGNRPGPEPDHMVPPGGGRGRGRGRGNNDPYGMFL